MVFDLFGTLVPEFGRTDFFETIRAMARVLGADDDRFVAAWNDSAIGRQTGVYPTVAENIGACCVSIGTVIEDGRLEEAVALRTALYDRWFRPRPGAVETLSALRDRRIPLAMISMCAPDTPAMWRASELASLVDVAVFSCEVGLRKPDPAIYRHATDRLGVSPEGCIYVGDGAYGELSGAEAVGMAAYLLRAPGVDPAEMLTPEPEEDWTGPVIGDLLEVLGLVGG